MKKNQMNDFGKWIRLRNFKFPLFVFELASKSSFNVMKTPKANGSFFKIHKGGGEIEITVIIKSNVPLFKISMSKVSRSREKIILI